jgi:acyl-homoserine lactone acylase PvdQ
MKYLFFIALIVLVSCGQRSVDTKIERNAYNEPILRVTDAKTPQEGLAKLIEGQGYVFAKDRFVQMDILRRTSQGKLAELFGEVKKDNNDKTAYERDVEVISVGLPLAVSRTIEKIKFEHPDTYKALQDYSRGVNKFIAEIANNEHPELMRIYADITGDPRYVPTLWTPNDSAAVAIGISFYLSSSLYEKLSLGIMHTILSVLGNRNQLTSLVDMRPLADTFIVGNKPKQNGEAFFLSPRLYDRILIRKGFQMHSFNLPDCDKSSYPMPRCGNSNLGSNNSAANFSFTGREETILANDPHLPITLPNTLVAWAGEVKNFPELNMAGLQIPGAPGYLIGHNQFIAVGLTNLPADVNDIYLEQTNDEKTGVENKSGGFTNFVNHEYRIAIRNTSNGSISYKPLTLREVPNHGPVISDHNDKLKKIVERLEEVGKDLGWKNIVITYRWILHEGSSALAAVHKLNLAQSVEEINQALELYDGASQNFVFADRKGNIHYKGAGKFPIRNYLGHTSPPYAFIEFAADDPKYNWAGFRKDIPTLSNPNSGFIVTANNDPYGNTAGQYHYVNKLSKDYFCFQCSTGIRAKRYSDLMLEQKGRLTVEEMGKIQGDYYDLAANLVLKKILSQVPYEKLSVAAAENFRALAQWDGYSGITRSAPVFFYEWLATEFRDYFQVPKEVIDSATQMGFSDVAKENITSGWNDASKSLFQYDEDSQKVHITPIAVKTWFHQTEENLAKRSTKEKTISRLIASLEAATQKMRTKNKVGKVWGHINVVRFYDAMNGLLPKFFTMPIAQNGAMDTVNVAGPGYGPNLRLIMSLKPEGITAVNAMPGGNYSPSDSQNIQKELLAWRNNERRAFVHW